MNFQMMPAPTNEMAVGRKMSAFASDSPLIPSAKRAMTRPTAVEKNVDQNDPQRVVAKDDQVVLLGEQLLVIAQAGEFFTGASR